VIQYVARAVYWAPGEMHCNNLGLVLGLGLVRVRSRVRIRVKFRVSIMVRVSIRVNVIFRPYGRKLSLKFRYFPSVRTEI